MSIIARFRRRITIATALTLSLLILSPVFAQATVLATSASAETLIQLSSDPYTNATSQHQTEVEPDTYAFGSTIVAAFQAGRFSNAGGGGSSNIGWATSTNGGKTWKHGFLQGITIFAGGNNDRATDPSVAYDARHKVWLIAYLVIKGTAQSGLSGVFVSRSKNGGLTWGSPIPVKNLAGAPDGADKNWIVCDDTPASPFYGHCYTEWTGIHALVEMSTSNDGGKTWGSPKTTADNVPGLAGQPLVQPNGTVIVSFLGLQKSNNTIAAFTSTNGGISWNSTVTVTTIATHFPNNLRSGPVPSAEIDRSGKVYVVWQDCRFESGCAANDIVMTTSTNGTTWTAVQRIPIDPIGSGVDHFVPGLGVDKKMPSSTARLALAYYYYPVANCTIATCQLDVGFIFSTNGGVTWGGKEQLAGPMNVTWLAASTASAFFVGDYISTSFSGDDAFPVFAAAHAPSGGHLNEAMYTTSEDV